MILITSGPIVGEGVPQVTCSHTELSGLYKKIHVKTGTDQGLGGASPQVTSIVDLFILLQVLWTLQSKRGSRGGIEEEEKRL